MSNITKIKYLCSTSLAFFCLTCTAFAVSPNIGNGNGNGNGNNNSQIPTHQITIFEQEDEERIYDNHGFTRGDMTYLYKGDFDAKNIESVNGEVEDVVRVQFPDKDTYLIAIISSTGNGGRMALNLGPAWFLEEKGFSVNEGDEIQVKGSKVRVNGRNLLLVTELTMDGRSLNIRDKEGSPLWGTPKAQKGNGDSMRNGKKNNKTPNNMGWSK
ncbi:MAG: hypothetical protein JJU12_04815 [Chlamydiales bacterium]|nr:hypothetical protein [Chlamydiales bacterium]